MNKRMTAVSEVFEDAKHTVVEFGKSGGSMEVLVGETFFVAEFDEDYTVVKFEYFSDYERTEAVHNVVYRDNLSGLVVSLEGIIDSELVSLLNSSHVSIEAWEHELVDTSEYLKIMQDKLAKQ